jgi:hypothetical protein
MGELVDRVITGLAALAPLAVFFSDVVELIGVIRRKRRLPGGPPPLAPAPAGRTSARNSSSSSTFASWRKATPCARQEAYQREREALLKGRHHRKVDENAEVP